ncbi:MAG: protein kinase, partial [Myxococcales bacterium]|nr:protein kinase [Myxococcales bacterium]
RLRETAGLELDGEPRGARGAAPRPGAGAAGARPGRPVRPAPVEGRTRPSAGQEPGRAEGRGPSALLAEEISQLAVEAVKAAMDRSLRGDAMRAMTTAPVVRVRAARTAVTRAAGLEETPIELELVGDAAVKRAREGPSVESLWRLIGQRDCDLQNIEVYYRLGLAYVSAGQWRDALKAFDAVEEASPGDRDADQRAHEIRGWLDAHGSKHLTLGTTTTPASGAPSGAVSAGRYLVQGELGRGGMAVVYRAVDTVLGRDVALKFIAEELGVSPQMRDMFQREARSAAQLNHPNVVTVYDFGLLEGRLFIAMEYLEGTTVEQLVDQGLLPVVESLRVATQVLAALEYAHGRQLVHRDVKPSNMIRTHLGLVKLMDFGLAKSVAQGAKASLVAGTPAYMPPEQFAGGNVDHRADLFAVGASLYEMLSGSLPFEGTDRSRPAASLRATAPALPAVLDDIVGRALCLDPAERWQTAAEFAAPLRDILAAVEQAAGAPATAVAPLLTTTEARTLRQSPDGAGSSSRGSPVSASQAASARTEPAAAGTAASAPRGTWKSRG